MPMPEQKNPIPESGQAFRDMYANMVVNRISKGYEHATLGPNLHPVRWRNGQHNFAGLASLGVRPEDVVVDYGCGTLRIGLNFIDYLEPGNYVGLDIDQRILDIGLDILYDEQIEKKPVLKVISDETIQEIAKLKPRLIFSKGVVHHVPPADLTEYFSNIGALIQSDDCQALICHRTGQTTSQVSGVSWEYSFEDLRQAAKNSQLTLRPFPALGPMKKAWYELVKGV